MGAEMSQSLLANYQLYLQFLLSKIEEKSQTSPMWRSQVKFKVIYQRVQGHSVRLWAILLWVVRFLLWLLVLRFLFQVIFW